MSKKFVYDENLKREELWIENIYYIIYEDQPDYHYYFLLDDEMVLSPSGGMFTLYKGIKQGLKELYIIPCPQEYKNLFRVYIRDTQGKTKSLHLNGVTLENSIKNYQSIWKLLEKHNFPKAININGVGTIDFTRNKRVSNYIDNNIPFVKTLNDINSIITRNSRYTSNREYKEFVTILPQTFPKRVYFPLAKNKSKNIHCGQRKLLISEINFLLDNNCKEKDHLILYIGASPGFHILILSKLFPLCKFILFDPLFNKRCQLATKNICVRAERFTLEMCKDFESDSHEYLLISDIRTSPSEGRKTKDYKRVFEEHVYKDLQFQKQIVLSLKPKASLVKFRLPFYTGDTSFLQGDLSFQAWSPKYSAELRMGIRDDTKESTFSNTDIEQKMFYFNTVYRPSSFYDIDPLFGKCFDTLYESYVIKRYLESKDPLKVLEVMAFIDKNLTNTDHSIVAFLL